MDWAMAQSWENADPPPPCSGGSHWTKRLPLLAHRSTVQSVKTRVSITPCTKGASGHLLVRGGLGAGPAVCKLSQCSKGAVRDCKSHSCADRSARVAGFLGAGLEPRFKDTGRAGGASKGRAGCGDVAPRSKKTKMTSGGAQDWDSVAHLGMRHTASQVMSSARMEGP